MNQVQSSFQTAQVKKTADSRCLNMTWFSVKYFVQTATYSKVL